MCITFRQLEKNQISTIPNEIGNLINLTNLYVLIYLLENKCKKL